MSLILRSAAVSDVGLVRSNNEDSAHAGSRLLAIADGIGGLPAGELASDIVIRALAPLDASADGADPVSLLRTAVIAANERIREAAEEQPSRTGMGTTVTALLLSGERLGMVHVGDSRAYRFRDGTLTQLTKDDTFVQSLVDQGVLTPEDARRHPQRSLVTRAVQGERVDPYCIELTPRVADRFLLCSDGLSDFVIDDLIAQALTAYADSQQSAEALVKLALQAGGPDNVTVIIGDLRDA
jgi:protein phosphatase